MANQLNTTLQLSCLTTDPVLRAFFQRGEQDTGEIEADTSPAPVLIGGNAAELVLA